MYYRKYFEGTVAEGTATTVYKIKRNNGGASTTSLATCNPKRNKVIGDAIVSTLKDCGLTNAYYDATCSYVFFDKGNSDFGMYITCESSYVQLYAGFYSKMLSTDIIQNATSTYFYARGNEGASGSPFYQSSYLVASDYKFYVTVRGDTAGIFTLGIGTYNSPSSFTIYATFYRGVDKRTNKALWGFCMAAQPSTNVYWVFADTLIGVIDTNTSSPYPPITMTPATKLTMGDEWVVLIEMYMSTRGYVTVDNTYIDPGFSASGAFYEINGEMYFCYTPYLIKCTTPVSAG